MKKSKILFLTALCLITILACKKQKKEKEDDSLVARDLNDIEINIAKNICESLKSKRKYFLRLSNGVPEGEFTFDVSFADCHKEIKNEGFVNTNFEQSRYIFQTRGRSYPRFMSNIINDEKGPMKDYCYEILERGNTKNLKNIVDLGDEKLVYSFGRNGGYEFKVETYLLENDKWSALAVDFYNIIKSSDRRDGMIKTRVRTGYCSGSGNYIIKQVLR